MKRLALILMALFIIAFLGVCQEKDYADFKGAGSTTDQNRPLALVDNDTITLFAFNRSLNNNGWHRQEKLDTMNFKKNVLRDDIVYRAARLKAPGYPLMIDNDVQVRLEDHLQTLLLHMLFENNVKSRVTVTNDNVKAAYDNNLGRYAVPERARVYQILFSTNKLYVQKQYGLSESVTPQALDSFAQVRMNQVIKELRAGKNFEEMARLHSDDTVSGNKGGDFGFINIGETYATFDSVVFAIPLDSISGPIFTPFGYHLIKVTDRRPASYLPLDSNLAQMIKGELEGQMTKAMAARFFDSLVAVSILDYNEDFINGPDSGVAPNTWVVNVNDRDTAFALTYYNWERRELAKDRAKPVGPQLRREILQNLGNRLLLVSEARKLGYDKTQEYADARNQFIFMEKLNRLMSERFAGKYEPSDKEIKDYYLAHSQKYVEDTAISIQQVILPDEKTARQVKAILDRGANFYETAVKYFPGEVDDIKEMAINLGWITSHDISRDFFNKIYGLKIGEISEPIKTQWGYHIVNVLGKTGLKPLAQVQADIKAILIKGHEDATKEKWEEKMIQGCHIRVDRQLLKDFVFQVDWLPKPDFSKMFPLNPSQ